MYYFYFDASALVKRYTQETGSGDSTHSVNAGASVS